MREKSFSGRLHRPSLWVQGVVLILMICAFASPALAHKVMVFAHLEGDTVYIESKFVPGGPVHQGKIRVIDQKTGKELLTGQTDDQGKFSFKMPPEALAQKMDLSIVIEAGESQQGEWLLKAH